MRGFIFGVTVFIRAVTALDQPTSPENSPGIALTAVDGQVQVIYDGTLQVADTLGSWSDLTNAANPYVVDPRVGSGTKYFRARWGAGIFSSAEILTLSVRGPLQEHFDLAFAGLPDGIFPPMREKPWFAGEIAIGQQTIPVELRVRGNSSLQECPFPKLKFKVSRANREGTPLSDAREVKIGTHCAEGGRGPIGRLRDERAAFREALVYELMQTLEFLSPRIRRARIEYHDTSDTNGPGEIGWTLSRHAMILEDVEVVAERLGGRALNDSEVETLTNAHFGLQLVTELQMFHVMIGNWDYTLSPDGTEAWNFDVVELPDLRFVPIAGDFDLSSIVTEEVLVDAPLDYHPELPVLERQARYDLEQIHARVQESGTQVFATAKERFESKLEALQAKVTTALIDDSGRANAAAHLSAFFSALDAVGRSRN
jgi:hypothetical protein